MGIEEFIEDWSPRNESGELRAPFANFHDAGFRIGDLRRRLLGGKAPRIVAAWGRAPERHAMRRRFVPEARTHPEAEAHTGDGVAVREKLKSILPATPDRLLHRENVIVPAIWHGEVLDLDDDRDDHRAPPHLLVEELTQ